MRNYWFSFPNNSFGSCKLVRTSKITVGRLVGTRAAIAPNALSVFVLRQDRPTNRVRLTPRFDEFVDAW